MMFAIGFFATIGHLFLILSLKYADASKLAPFGYFEIITNMLLENKKITAIICSTEFSALSAIKACNNLNYEIGKDISIITFDGPLVRDLSTPPLTAASFPVKELGKRAISILLNKDRNSIKFSNYLAKSKKC